ncbi:MAG: glucokinase [Cocleimonas sp.]|jgi:glucokinase
MSFKDYSLIADIGGTNARFALLEGNSHTPIEAVNLVCADYPSIVDAVRIYLDSVSFAKPDKAAIAVATVVANDQLKMTNNAWEFSIEETRQTLELDQLKVINDFTGLALAIPHLSSDQYHKVGGGTEVDQHVKAVIGPGTGLGVSGAIPLNGSWFPLQGEGGHTSYGPLNKRESQIIEIVKEHMTHVSAESLVSGAGLSLLYQSISQLKGVNSLRLDPEQISLKAVNGSCPIASEALSIFCQVLGSVAGNLALTLGSRGGVYIGGGIVPKVLEYFSASDFRIRFEQKGRFTKYLSGIPTYVITAKYPALTGAAFSLNPEYKEIGITSYS